MTNKAISPEAVETHVYEGRVHEGLKAHAECYPVSSQTKGYMLDAAAWIEVAQPMLRALSARIQELEKSEKRTTDVLSLEGFKDAATAIIEYQHMKATVEELEKALKPFAEACRNAEVAGTPPASFVDANSYETARSVFDAAQKDKSDETPSPSQQQGPAPGQARQDGSADANDSPQAEAQVPSKETDWGPRRGKEEW